MRKTEIMRHWPYKRHNVDTPELHMKHRPLMQPGKNSSASPLRHLMPAECRAHLVWNDWMRRAVPVSSYSSHAACWHRLLHKIYHSPTQLRSYLRPSAHLRGMEEESVILKLKFHAHLKANACPIPAPAPSCQRLAPILASANVITTSPLQTLF